MKRKLAALTIPAQVPEQKYHTNMSTNPLSIPGGWRKDTPATEKQDPSE